MKKILFLLCITTVSYAQTTLKKLTTLPKQYTVQEVSTFNGKAYEVTDQKDLTVKRYDINKNYGVYDVTETTLYKKKESKESIYDNVYWTTRKKKDEENE